MRPAILSLLRPFQRDAPLAAGWALKRATEIPGVLAGRLSRGSGDGWNLPPRRLRARTGAPGAEEFVHGGFDAAQQLAAGLRLADRDLAEARAILDFGCGSGRVLPFVASLAPGARCTGCDVDPSAIAWATRHRPDLRWSASGFAPPLPFSPAGFDLIYSISVFSHLDEPTQDRWLSELQRVMAPGAFALLTVHGPHALEQFRSGRARTRWCRAEAFARGPLGAGEFVFEPYLRSVWNRAELPRVGASYGLAFHGHEYIRRHWSRTFEVLAIQAQAIAGWQDLVVCRNGARPSVGMSP